MEDSKNMQVQAKILDKMRYLCSKREYCSADIMKKIMTALAKHDPALTEEELHLQAETILKRLVEDKYIDDCRYATAFVNDKSSLSGWGVTKIRYALTAKQIDREIIDSALSAIDQEKAVAKLEKALMSKHKALSRGCDDPGSQKLREKLLRFALSRGYTFSQALPIIEKLLGE